MMSSPRSSSRWKACSVTAIGDSIFSEMICVPAFAYAAVVIVSAVVGGTLDQYRQKAKGAST
jgi:hypothetical protein